MRSFSTLALLGLPLLGPVLAEQKQAEQPSSIYSSAHEAFQDLLNALPEESLQAALSGLKDFKTGIFESHHRGVEHVHDKNPALATKLIVAAVQDLKKRQTPSNGTSPIASPPPVQTSIEQQPPPAESTPPPAQQSTPPPPANTPAASDPPPAQSPSPPADRPIIVPVPITTTNQQGQTVIQTASVLSAPTASIPIVLTRNGIATTELRPAVIRTLTDARGRLTTTTSAAQFAPTPGEVRTETDGQGKTFVTTYTPGGGTISSIKLITTTGPDGRPSVVTSYEFVDPVATPAGGGGGDAARSSTGKPSVQTNAAGSRGKVVGYALAGGALAMFV